MNVSRVLFGSALLALAAALQTPAAAQRNQARRLEQFKREAVQEVEARAKLTQEMVDQIFSFGELGFQEFETSRYLVELLRREGFTVQENYAGIPTAWVATWGSGKPVISLGSDIDGIPQANQTPGVACHKPLVPGAPGHGEGHNSGQAVNITAALAVKKIMERERIPGTLQLWPGVAEELVGTKAYFVREGLFRDVDIALFSHVGSNLSTSWGGGGGNALVSVLFSFEGQTAHSAGAPWRGRSALDAVELMNVAWNYRREHLRLSQRSHYVIVDGGDQPNVVPRTASVWYYFRELDYPTTMHLWAIGDSIARGAALMTGTKLVGQRVLGSAWSGHFNKVVAEVMWENIKRVGLPQWSEADQQLARGLQRELGVPDSGLATKLPDSLRGPVPENRRFGGGSDDIGDVSWNVPTIVLSFPSNIPNLPGHNWSNAVAMATPIAHKGATAGAKAMAMTILDFLLRPELVNQAWDYFRNVQTKEAQYQPFIRPEDKPAIELNRGIMARYREEMRKYYYDPSRYSTYLEQLGVQYPTLRSADGTCGGGMVP
ncbi:MAG: aminobenzoyl-glutamate utilization protein B [Gemmatimonadales bacterium]|nr:MAG: aminobenzoyl-glutamate utilization protein B [Gemmatimonadales bacterium]